jgi:hypothetical protein
MRPRQSQGPIFSMFVTLITATRRSKLVGVQCLGGRRVSKVQRKASGKNEPFWPAALIAFALSLTAVWLGLTGFGLMQLIDLL